MEEKRDTKEVEDRVLETFKEEIPSLYFSDKSDKEYRAWTSKQSYLFHDLLHFPPKMFAGSSLIDFGAGTGESTIQFANWGAKCTLLDLNEDACRIAREVFRKYAKRPDDHDIICTSIFDHQSVEQYDIVVSSGVIHHTGDKEYTFSKFCSFLKPGGYFILGIGNKVGSFQNMLQRMIIFAFAKTNEEIVQVAEELFKEDIDRSQQVTKRSRRAIIFDRFVVPKQDDPTVSEVLRWFSDNGLKFYSSYPPILPPVLGDSYLNPPTFEPQDFLDIGAFSEAFWLVHRDEDIQEVPKILDSFKRLSESQFDLTNYVNDFNLDTIIDHDVLPDYISRYQLALNEVDLSSYIKRRHKEFFDEVNGMLKLVRESNLEKLSSFLESAHHIFRGANGLRTTFFVAYKTA